MKKRDFLKAGIVAGAAAGISGPLGTPALAMGSDDKSKHKTGFLLLHGSWHGAWAWTEVARHLNQAGYPTIAIDFPGHGLDAILPQSSIDRAGLRRCPMTRRQSTRARPAHCALALCARFHKKTNLPHRFRKRYAIRLL